MKLRRGERIVCSKGHHVGDILADVPDDEPVPTEALSMSGPISADGRYAYICGRCHEAVAWFEDGRRWRVRTVQGWVK